MGNAMAFFVKVFFRQVDIVGSFRIPKTGPVIFIANHSNQFVDPMMLSSCVDREVRYLCAAKSMRRPLIGRLARAAKSISVERAQDIAFKGRGTLSVEEGSTQASGEGTAFSTELQPGCKITAGKVELTVKSVQSDTVCTVIAASCTVTNARFKVFPKVDQHGTFSAVDDALKAGNTVGIFPEGGSHDRTGLLELKPGVAIMALGAMTAGSAPVQIVPCGMTYFDAHRFRSRAVVEFGQPIEVPTELAEQYAIDKRGAVAQLMAMVEDGLNAVVPKAADYGELQALITMKALYRPRDHKLTPEESLRLTKRFTQAAKALKDNEQMKQMLKSCREYNEMLRAAGMRDRDVRRSSAGRNFSMRTMGKVIQVVLLAPLALPAILLFLPVALVTSVLSERERVKALAGSSVKVQAMDVVASYKILVSVVFVPAYNFLLAILITWFFDLDLWMLPLSFFILQPVCEYILILVCDQFVMCFQSCRASLRLCFWGGNKAGHRLEKRRADLAATVCTLVEELGPEVFGEEFEKHRVIRASSLHEEEPVQNADAHLLFGDSPTVANESLPGAGGRATDPLLERPPV